VEPGLRRGAELVWRSVREEEEEVSVDEKPDA